MNGLPIDFALELKMIPLEKGITIFTGLSGSEINNCKWNFNKVLEKGNRPVTSLDGDLVRIICLANWVSKRIDLLMCNELVCCRR